jgi:NADH-quinone oxidoreductase subunit G
MAQVKVIIDGKECIANEGETILNVARANDIFIPGICYLDRCSPTLACRLCLVEANGKQAYSCNAKVKDGMIVNTVTDNIKKERQSIMQVYDVNHPLQCGVCDQSGECELQNYTLYEGIKTQNYAVRDVHRPVKNWGHIQYDPGLCIVCEKCVTVCKDMVGDAALKTIPRGADKLDLTFKETMPKDSYAMWNKLNKSLIGTVTGETLDCSSCGECSAVCPVGALVSTDFKYTSNAWELKKIPSTCVHCSVGCQLYYEVKQTSISDSTKKIYRVTNETHFESLCGAGRYGYDFENKHAEKDPEKLAKAVEAVKNADTFIFNSQITNEEALILQKLKEKLGFKLVNKEAKRYQDFLKAFSKVRGKEFYDGDLRYIRECNFVISVGSFIKYDSPNSRYAFNNSMKVNKGAGLYFHPIEDKTVQALSKNLVQIAHKPLADEVVLKFILAKFGKDLPEKIKEIVENTDFTDLNLPENFDATLEKLLKKKDTFGLIAGEDLYTSPNWKTLAELLALIELYTDFKTVLIPSNSNTLGVSQICELDDEVSGKTVAYNEEGDFVITSIGLGDLQVPALNQQEGTFLNINKRVVRLNPALDFDGYSLNDIASQILDEPKKWTIDWTKELFEKVAFDDISVSFDNKILSKANTSSDNLFDGYPGYPVQNKDVEKISLDEVDLNSDKIADLNGKVFVYRANPILQFGKFTNKTHQLHEASAKLYLSETLAQKVGLHSGGLVKISTKFHKNTRVSAVVDKTISGDFAYLPTFSPTLHGENFFKDCRFTELKITKV